MKHHQRSNHNLYNHSQHQQSNQPPLIPFKSYTTIFHILNQDPHSLTY